MTNLSPLITKEVDNAISQYVGSIDNKILRKAIEESVREAVYTKLTEMLPNEINSMVKESIDEITDSLNVTVIKTRKSSSDLSSSFPSSDLSGSKTSSGGKSTPTPVRRTSFGGKGGSFGGK